MLKMIGMAVKGNPLPPERLDELVADLRRNDPTFVRGAVHAYLQYLDRYGSVAGRLGDADVPTWVVHGEIGDGGITDDERATLQACPQVTLMTIPGRCFFIPNEEPALVAGLVRQALGQPVP
jgi:pimeloyl-ACP methyl ester carboxylesterase